MTLEEAKKEILGMSMGAIGERGMNPLKEGISYDGLIRTYDDILAILAKVDTEPAQKDKMTLTELAYVLRKFFRFNYLTYHGNVYDECDICLWEVKPTYCDISWRISPDESCMVIYPEFLTMNLDLSEYKDEDGNIDYSKCIVEVTNVSE